MATKSEILDALGIPEDSDNKSVELLMKALKAEQLPGFDYIKFKQSLKALTELNMDTATAMKSAFATASTLGVTRDKLIKTAKHYQNILQREKQQFDEAAENQVTQRIAAKEQEINKLETQIQECHDQIATLQKLIGQLGTKLEKARSEKDNSAEKINEAKLNFESSYKTILAIIESDIQAIESNIS